MIFFSRVRELSWIIKDVLIGACVKDLRKNLQTVFNTIAPTSSLTKWTSLRYNLESGGKMFTNPANCGRCLGRGMPSVTTREVGQHSPPPRNNPNKTYFPSCKPSLSPSWPTTHHLPFPNPTSYIEHAGSLYDTSNPCMEDESSLLKGKVGHCKINLSILRQHT